VTTKTKESQSRTAASCVTTDRIGNTHRGFPEAPTAATAKRPTADVGVIELHVGAVQSRAPSQFAQFGYGLNLHEEDNI
jgi:hypothetical protein